MIHHEEMRLKPNCNPNPKGGTKVHAIALFFQHLNTGHDQKYEMLFLCQFKIRIKIIFLMPSKNDNSLTF